MIDKYSELRLFLTSIGMLQTSYYSYATTIPSNKYRTIDVTFDIVSGKLHIIYPDIEYNKQNPYSPKKNNVAVATNPEDFEICKHTILKAINNFV
jgi:hypothetical protein